MSNFTVPAGTVETKLVLTAKRISIVDILDVEHDSVKRGILNAFMASLSIALVNACRSHIRYESNVPNNGIDGYNELKSKQDAENLDAYWTKISGGTVDVPAIDIAQRLGFLRNYVQDLQVSAHQGSARWQPRPLAESIEFLLGMMKTEVNETSPSVLVVAKITGKDPKIVAAMMSANETRDRDMLVRDAPDILSLAESLCRSPPYGDNDHYLRAIHAAFDSLPVITQINLFTAAVNACVSAYNSAFSRVCKGRAEFAADMTFAENVHRDGLHSLKLMISEHEAEIAEFEDRGGKLKEVKRLS